MSRQLIGNVLEHNRTLTDNLGLNKKVKRGVWGVKHGRHATPGPAHYSVSVEMPADFEPIHLLSRLTPASLDQAKRQRDAFDIEKAKYDDCPDGRWITVHPNGADEDGHPVYICPNSDGSYTVTRGAGGALNGLKLTGIKSEDEYKQIASQRREEKRQAKQMEQEARVREVGAQQYLQEQQDKKQRILEAESVKRSAEENFIKTVLGAQGIDPAQVMDAPQKAMAAEGTDAGIADRVQAKHHAKLLAYAHKVAAAVKEQVATGLDGISADLASELSADSLADEKMNGAGTGYSSPVRALAAEYGLSVAASQQEGAGVRFRSLLERSGGDYAEAIKKQEAIQGRTEARRKSDEEVKDASGKLEELGLGPNIVSRLSTVPTIENLQQAVDILKAERNSKLTGTTAQRYIDQVDNATDLDKVPKASMLVTSDISDDEAKQAIADTLGQDAMQRAMFGVLGTARQIEDAHGSLREHYSVGQNVAYNSILSALDHTSIDPILHDLLGAPGASAVIAERLHQSLGKEDFEAVRQALVDQHIATQEQIATQGVQEADEYLDRAEALATLAPKPDSPEGLMAAVEAQAERMEHINRAKEVIGISLGRLEAAASLNEAMGRRSGGGSPKSLKLSLGAISPDAALRAFYALGLTNPSQYDAQTGETTHDGDVDLYADGKNTFAEIKPEGIAKLAAPTDEQYVERARRSANIKNGYEDEPGWLPAGITGRKSGSDVDTDSLRRNSIKHELKLTPGDDVDGVQVKLRRYIGALMHEGRDPDEIAAHVRSAEFAAGLGLDSAMLETYEHACGIENPKYMPTEQRLDTPEAQKDEIDRFTEWEKERDGRFSQCLDEYLGHENVRGDDLLFQRQRLDTNSPDVLDAAHIATVADMRTQHAFKAYGALDDAARAQVRSWAYENVFGQGAGTKDETLQPLTYEERSAYDKWKEISRNDDPYHFIQNTLIENTGVDLFGDSEPPVLASVDLSDDAAVIRAARLMPQSLGYVPLKGEHGDMYPDLDPDSKYVADGTSWILDANSPGRSQETIASDARLRIKRELRKSFFTDIMGNPELAHDGFNPANVKTSGEKFADYVQSMGDMAAYSTIQDYMKGDVAERFATELASKGVPLQLGIRAVGNAERHAIAMLPPDKRKNVQSSDKSEQAKAMRRAGGKFIQTGAIKDRVELQKKIQEQSAKLFALGKEHLQTNVYRATIGDTAERELANMIQPIGGKGKVLAAKNVSMDGNNIPRQRAIKLILQNKRQGVQLGTGGGKTIVALGAFTQARANGEAKRALFTVPSNIVGQFSNEIHAFRDPQVPLRWFSTDGESADRRRTAHSNPNLHIVITTPESLREDVTHALAQHLNISTAEARDKIMSDMPETQRNAMIHDALDASGMDYDYVLNDEGHRLLTREGKPDAHMQRVADALGSRATHYVYSTADPVKNDVSEAWNVLHKIDPLRYDGKSRDLFMRKYGRNVTGSALALQRELSPYSYADKIDLGIDENHSTSVLDLTPEQKKAHDQVNQDYNIARHAKLRGKMDIEALKRLNPHAFEEGARQGLNEYDIAKNQNKAIAVLRDTAIDRVVNAFPNGVKHQAVLKYLDEEAHGEPTVVFAHSLEAVKSLEKELKAKGYRVGAVTGSMSGRAKSKVQQAFFPASAKDPTIDVLVASDAAAVGGNLQRGVHLINMDVPKTAMVHRQRIGRIVRPGQKSSQVQIRDLVSNTDYDRRNRRRLEDKSALREILTSPMHSIDDSGLTERIQHLQLSRVLKEGGQ